MSEWTSIVIVRDSDGARLCQDNKWRTFCSFGTFSSCVKQYHSKGYAQRKASQLCERGNGSITMQFLYPDRQMDASGKILQESY